MATRRAAGATVARDVRDGRPGGIPLVRAGATLTDRYAQSLVRAGINAIYVEDAVGEDIEVTQALTEQTRRAAETALSTAFKDVPAAIASERPLSAEAVAELESVAKLIASEIAAAGDAVLALADLGAADAYTLQHSIDVAVLGLLVGRRLLLDQRENGGPARTFGSVDETLVRLGVGLLLHDIGKLAVPREILDKPGPLDADEWEVMKSHPVIGVELLTTELIGYHAKAVVRSHHERWDGGGYPEGRRGEDVALFARVAMVADVYDAVTSDRPYRPAAPAAVGHRVILEGSGTAFDPEVVGVFKRVVAPYPPGVEVKLSDGRCAVVANVPRGHADRPVVRVFADENGSPIDTDEISLLDHPELGLEAVAA